MQAETCTKNEVKKIRKKEQGGVCTISGQTLEHQHSLTDVHYKGRKGKLNKENVDVVEPVAHMKLHGNYKEREEDLCMLKSILDDREQVRKLFQKINNQILAYKRKTDKLNQVTLDWLFGQLEPLKKELAQRDAMLKKQIIKISKYNSLVRAALGVNGIGPVTVAYCMVFLDFKVARHATNFWSYTGIALPAHQRYEKGKKGGGNKALRTVLYTMADSQLKTRGAYREVYDNMKHRLENSDKITTTRTVATKEAPSKLVQKPWKDVYPQHRHCASLRAISKHFLADLWYVGRQYYELPTTLLYPEAILGGTHRTIMPSERGWVLEKTISQED